MVINLTKKSEVSVLELVGRCEIQDFDLLSQHLNEIIDRGEKKLVLDFAGLNFINSAGLRAVIVAVQKMKNSGGKVVFCNLNETVEKLFGITGYSDLLESFRTTEEAVESFDN